MKTEIIAVGSELMTPWFPDTNSTFLTERLNEFGIQVSFRTVVGDDEEDLMAAVRASLRRSRLILAVGGLGPTEDDRTRECFARALGRELVFKREILAYIRRRFERRGLAMPQTNKKQAFVIDGAEVLDNPRGTAPGLWLDDGRRRIALLPGPPRELQPMFENHLKTRMAAMGTGRLVRRTFKITGMGESSMESRMKDIYRSLPPDVSVTTLSAPGDLSIRLTCRVGATGGDAIRLLDGIQNEILRRFGSLVYSTAGENIEEVVGQALKDTGKTVACAESCTGGLLGNRLTNVPGSSGYFLESVVSYSDGSKMKRLGVPDVLLERCGAVSAGVARAMAEGVRKSSGADFGLSVTGIAGPGGGSTRKPVGLVYVALAHENGTAVKKNLFFGEREHIKFQSSQKAIDLLRIHLTKMRKRGYNKK